MLTVTFFYFTSCLMQLVHIIAFKTISNHENKIYWKHLFWIFITSILITLANLKSLYILNSILSIIFIFLLYYLIFRKNIKETIYYGFTIWLIGMIIDVIIMFKNNYLPFNIEINLLRTLDTFIMIGIIMLVVNIKPFQKWLKNFFEKLKKQNFSYLKIGYILLLIISLTYTLMESILNSTANNSLIIFISLVMPLIILYINKEYNNFALNQTKNNLIKSNEFYVDVVNDCKILKHNIIHQLNGVKSVANEKSIKLIDDIISQYSNIPTDNLKRMPVGINGIVYEKIYNYNHKEIRMGIENNIESDIFDNLSPRSYNLLCEALGVLLDNALEATLKSNEKIVMLDMTEQNEYYSIKIINTFINGLDLEKLGSINYTTKEKGHGVGLFSLIGRKKIKIKTSIINNLFQNEIYITKKRS